MLMRYFHLAILATTTVASALSISAPESAGDMARQLNGDWDIQSEDGYPTMDFDGREVIFKFNYTGTLTTTKFLEVNIYQSDCTSASDASLPLTEAINGRELFVDIDIIEDTISKSVHYQDAGLAAASIGFCLRVDYNYIDGGGNTESINFYETNVTITVDLSSNFTLTGITIGGTAADNKAADVDIDYPVEAYICLDDNSEVANPEPLAQGSILQVCIKIDVIENVLVEDILTFVLTQPDSENTEASYPVTNTIADPLTDKICREGGICNVKTQLLTKFFTDTNQGDLRVDGVAIVAFGKASLMPSSAPTAGARRLRVPIRGLLTGDDVKAFMTAQQSRQQPRQQDSNEAAIVSAIADSSQRMLQAGAAQSAFGLQVGLQGIDGEGDSSSQASSSSGGSAAVVAVLVLIMLAVGCGLGFLFCTKGRARKEDNVVNKHQHHPHSSAASVGTYPSQGSVPNTVCVPQYANYRGSAARDARID
jgi:hypothetical protein